MKANDKVTKRTTQLKQTVVEGVQNTTEKLEKIAQDAKTQAIEVLQDTQSKIEVDVDGLNQSVRQKLEAFKDELIQRLSIIKNQVNLSQQDLIELKDFVKKEFNVVLGDLTAFGQSLKQDVTEIKTKHKDHLHNTVVRTKTNAKEVWNKVQSH